MAVVQDFVNFSRNQASISAIIEHLNEADNLFEPRLSSRVDLSLYASKLFKFAERLEAWEGKLLVGLVAVYCNGNSAFVSSVSVLTAWQHRGVARELMRQCLSLALEYQMPFISLEVSSTALPAIALYQSLGFTLHSEINHRCTLTRNLSFPSSNSLS